MRITCPSCQAIYDVPDALLARARAQGTHAPAKLRCARCAHEWVPVELAPPAPVAKPIQPEPIQATPGPSPFADALAQALPARPPAPEPEPMPQATPPAEDEPAPRLPDLGASDQRAPARFPPRPAAPPRDAATLFFAWCLSLGVLAALLIAAYVHQADIVAFWPPAARAYDLLGLK